MRKKFFSLDLLVRSSHFFLFALTMFVFNFGLAGNSGISYQGRILRPDGTPLESSTVQFRMQIRSPGSENCLLYDELQTIDMSGSAGLFSLTLNDGSGTRIDTPSYQVDRIFANRGVMTLDNARCAVGMTYTPNPGDGRKFIVYFKDSTLTSFEPLPILSLNFSSQSMYALESQAVGTFAASNILRAVDGSGNPVTAPALDPTQLTNFTNLLAGTSTQYATSANFNAVQTFAKTALPTCAAGEVLKSNGTALSCVTDATGGGGGGGGTVTGVTATAPVASTGGTAPVISMSQANTTTAGYLSSTDWNSFNNKLSSTLASGSLFVGNGSSVATGVAPSGDVTMSNAGAFTVTKLQGSAVSATSPTTAGQILRYSGTQWVPNYISMFDLRSTITGATSFSTGCTAGQTLTWTAATDNLACTNIAVNDSQVSNTVSRTANTFLAAPNGSAGAASYRAIASADLPNIGSGLSGVLPAANGGTGQSSFAVGDLLYASSSSALSRLPASTSGYVLTSGGAGVAPSWSAAPSGALSGLSAATGNNAINNANFAQTWNWNSATTESAMSMTANALTTGSILNVTSSSAAMNSTNGLLNVANSSATTTGVLARFQSNSAAGSGMTILNSGNIGIGTAGPSQKLDVQGNIGIADNKIGGGSGYGCAGCGASNSIEIYNSGTAAMNFSGTNNGGSAGFNFYLSGSPAVRISDGGNLGIGTTSPGRALTVSQRSTSDGIQLTGTPSSGPGGGTGFIFNLGYNIAGNKQMWLGDPDYLSNGNSTFFRYVTVNGVTSIDSVNGTGTTRAPVIIGTPDDGINGPSNITLINDSSRVNPAAGVWVNGNASVGAGYKANAPPSNGLIVQGNVGIGRTNPAALLDVNGTMRVSQICDSTGANCKTVSSGWSSGAASYSSLTGASSTNSIDNTNFSQTWNWSTAATESAMSLTANSLTTGSMLNISTSSNSLNSTSGLLNIANTGSSTSGTVARIQSNSTAGSGLTVLANGNVGIGTTAPSYPLHVKMGTTGTVGSFESACSGCASILETWNSATWTGNSYSQLAFIIGPSGSRGQYATINGIATSSLGGALAFSTATSGGPTEKMRIDTNGNVGIGTTAPEQILDVRGVASTQTVVEGAASYVNSGASYSIPDSSLSARRITLTANTTLTLPSFTSVTNRVYTLTVFLKQDATGGRTVSWLGNGSDVIKWDAGVAPTISATANKISIVQFTKVSDEAVWYGSIIWKED